MLRHLTRGSLVLVTLAMSVLSVATVDARPGQWRSDNDIVRMDGDVTVGPGARANGDVVTVTGDARIGRSIQDIGSGGRSWSGIVAAPGFGDGWFWRVGGLVVTLSRIAVLALLALALTAVGRSWIERVADRAESDPLRAGLIGVAAQILFIPVLLVLGIALLISIVGIPLLALIPFVLLLTLALLVVGFTGVSYHVGRLVQGRLGGTDRSAYVTVLFGVMTIVATTVLGRSVAMAVGGSFGWPLSAAGYLVEYVAWTFGLGSAILALVRPAAPPPLPA